MYELREAARFGQYTWREWEELDSRDQADVIAHYRLNGLIRTHIEDAVNREIKRRNPQKTGG